MENRQEGLAWQAHWARCLITGVVCPILDTSGRIADMLDAINTSVSQEEIFAGSSKLTSSSKSS
jgi:hypothetical protein